MEYNTTRPKLILSEYGRHIQKMIDYAKNIEDKQEREKAVQAIINLMGQLNPHLRDVADFKHKLWDHLFIISNFELEVTSPYNLPDKELLNKRPEKLPYPKSTIKYAHYGKYLEQIINVVKNIEDEDKKAYFTNLIVSQMKRNYMQWNRDTVTDDLIAEQLKELSEGNLIYTHNSKVNYNHNTSNGKKKKRKNKQQNSKSNRKKNFL